MASEREWGLSHTDTRKQILPPTGELGREHQAPERNEGPLTPWHEPWRPGSREAGR